MASIQQQANRFLIRKICFSCTLEFFFYGGWIFLSMFFFFAFPHSPLWCCQVFFSSIPRVFLLLYHQSLLFECWQWALLVLCIEKVFSKQCRCGQKPYAKYLPICFRWLNKPKRNWQNKRNFPSRIKAKNFPLNKQHFLNMKSNHNRNDWKGSQTWTVTLLFDRFIFCRCYKKRGTVSETRRNHRCLKKKKPSIGITKK